MAVRTNRLVRSAAAVTLVGAGVAAGITGSVSTAVAQTPTPVLTVVSSSSYGPEPDGFLYIVGEVQNTGTDDVQDGTVQVGLYNVGGTQLAIDTRTIEVSELAPGEKGGFVDIVPPPSGYDHFKILGATGIDDGTPPYRQFSVTGVTDVANSGGLHQVNATVTNTGYYTAQNVKADMTFYNAAGIVVDVDTFPLNGGASLAPAATTALAENDIPAHIQYTRFAVLIEGTTTTPACGPCVPFTRIGGTTRIGTAVLTSQDTFPTAGTAKAVVLARADTFPDALAGGPLAAHVGGPLLLTEPTGLDPATQAEIVRVAPAGSTVYILGGPSAVASSVDPILTGLGYKVQRVFGADRYATAVAVAGVLGNPATVFEATGINFPDALSGGPAAVANTAAILLTDGAVQAPATAAYLVAHASMRYALGGPAAAGATEFAVERGICALRLRGWPERHDRRGLWWHVGCRRRHRARASAGSRSGRCPLADCYDRLVGGASRCSSVCPSTVAPSSHAWALPSFMPVTGIPITRSRGSPCAARHVWATSERSRQVGESRLRTPATPALLEFGNPTGQGTRARTPSRASRRRASQTAIVAQPAPRITTGRNRHIRSPFRAVRRT
jgi:hypothetical protein